MASVDLDWSALDKPLASKLVELLNRQLTNTKRPSFIGPISIHSLDFGSAVPDIEVLDIQDIYQDFLEGDDDLEEPPTADEYQRTKGRGLADEGYEWVGQGQAYPQARSNQMNPPGSNDMRSRPAGTPMADPFLSPPRDSSVTPNSSFASPPADLPGEPPEPVPPPASAASQHPDLQLHLRITHHSNLRLTLSTSLLINHPSPMFMSLPVKLCITGLVFHGEVVVAYEGSRKRVHLCIVDDQAPYGPHHTRPQADEPRNNPDHSSKPLPIGQRLFPSIAIESEIGDADNHVLKNVPRIKGFIQDVIWKTAEEELVFPNFHTIILPERS